MKRLRLPNLRPWIPVLFLPLSLLLLMFSRAVPSFAEWYATGPYRWLSHWGNLLSFCIPYSSIGEMLVLAAIPVCLGYLIYFFIQWRKHRESRRETLCRFFRNALCAISLLAFLFTICCGINYSRYTFGANLRPAYPTILERGIAGALPVVGRRRHCIAPAGADRRKWNHNA